MSELTATRSVVLELKDEERAMREGHAFLDEKCLLLAGEIVAELDRYAALATALREASEAAARALAAAVARHGLEGLQHQPPGDLGKARLALRERSLMGVRLADASFVATLSAPDAVEASPEAARSRLACAQVVERSAALAAVAGNLERLSIEYQRSMRRARALADVLLPEVARTASDLATRLEELEQEDAIWMARAANA